MRKLVFIVLIMLVGCGSSRHIIELNGFDQGKHNMKFSFNLNPVKQPNGTKGYQLESTQTRGVGNMSLHKIVRTAQLDEKWFLLSSKMVRTENKKETTISCVRDGNKITITTELAGQPAQSRDVEVPGPVHIELHPLMYGNDLTQPNTEKVYRVFKDYDGSLQEIKVRFLGEKKMLENGKEEPALHYQIEVVPTQWDDYYLEPKTLKIMKIQIGLIQFLRPGVSP